MQVRDFLHLWLHTTKSWSFFQQIDVISTFYSCEKFEWKFYSESVKKGMILPWEFEKLDIIKQQRICPLLLQLFNAEFEQVTTF